jgi:hypothetical protein
MSRHFVFSLVLMLTLLGATAAQAGQVLLLRPLEAGRIGEYSNLGPVGENHQQVADSFVLAHAATLESISWYGRYDLLYSASNPVGFSVRVFDDIAGSPASAPSWVLNVSVNATPQGSDYLGNAWLAYSTALPNWSLGAGAHWISIVEAEAATPPYGRSQWLWGDTSGTGYRAIRGEDGAAWAPGLDVNHAVTLEGTVPEPGSSLLLLCVGIAGLRAWKRRVG